MPELESVTSIYSTKKKWARRDPGMPVTRQKRWADENREKLQAQASVRHAMRKGALSRGKCEVCGSMRVDAHHDDYSKPLSVRWLCRSHHQKWHAEQRATSSIIEAQS